MQCFAGQYIEIGKDHPYHKYRHRPAEKRNQQALYEKLPNQLSPQARTTLRRPTSFPALRAERAVARFIKLIQATMRMTMATIKKMFTYWILPWPGRSSCRLEKKWSPSSMVEDGDQYQISFICCLKIRSIWCSIPARAVGVALKFLSSCT